MTAESTSLGCATLDETSGSVKDESYREKAYREYYERAPNKVLELLNMDHIRRSMYRDLRQNYATNLSWARSLGIDPLAEGFDPTSSAAPELSSWLYLFYSYLQLEEAYAETSEWLLFEGPTGGRRLIDPPLPKTSFREDAQELWSIVSLCWTLERGKPGSRASQHKRY